MIIQKDARILVQLKMELSFTDGDIHACLRTALFPHALPLILKTLNTFFLPHHFISRGKAVVINALIGGTVE